MTYDAAPDPSARQGRKTVNESQDTPLSEGSWQPFLTVNACGRDWTLERAADMEALWESMTEFTEDERLPYWTELWPSSLVLADWLYQRRESLRGQPCLDLGCGPCVSRGATRSTTPCPSRSGRSWTGASPR